RHHRKGRRLSLMYRWVRGKLVRFLFELQDENGSWFDLPLATGWYVVALLGCGVSPTDPRLVKSRSFFQGRKRESEGGLYVVGMDSTVWNTGLALRSITAAGVPDHSEFCMNAAAALE